MAAVSKVDANSKVTVSNAEAVAEIKMGEAKAAEISHEKDAEANHYGQLLSADIGMDQKDILKHTFLSLLEKKHAEATLFLGYKKIPIFTESGKSVPVTKNIFPGR